MALPSSRAAITLLPGSSTSVFNGFSALPCSLIRTKVIVEVSVEDVFRLYLMLDFAGRSVQDGKAWALLPRS